VKTFSKVAQFDGNSFPYLISLAVELEGLRELEGYTTSLVT
jgi:hypothetical protein